MLQNVLSFFTNYLPYFQMALGVWQFLKFTPPAAVIQGVMGWLLSLALPGFFPAYEQLRHFPGCLFKSGHRPSPSHRPGDGCRLTDPPIGSPTEHEHEPEPEPETESEPGSPIEPEPETESEPGSPIECETEPPIEPDRPTGRWTQTEPWTTVVCMPYISTYTNLNSTVASKPRTFVSRQFFSTNTNLNSTVASKRQADFISVDYLGETFVLKREENKVFVNGEMSYYISDRQWEKIRKMKEKYFEKEDGKGSEKGNEVVFVKGCQFIWPKVATGKIMEFGEVLDDFIFENNDAVLISNNVCFLPVDLSEKSEGKLPSLLNLVGLFFSTQQNTSLAKSFSIASAILDLCKPLRSCIYWIINKMFCRSVQYICNKLPYSVRKCVYLLFIRVENLKPRNDIRLKVVRCDYLNVVIGGSAKTNSAQEATQVDWLDQEEEYEFRCGSSIVMKATYDDVTRKCTATVQHTNAVFGTEERLAVKCEREQFKKIGTFLSCLATSKAGSLFKYDRNDNKVHVRGWRESLRHYVDAEFPDIYKVRLHDVIV